MVGCEFSIAGKVDTIGPAVGGGSRVDVDLCSGDGRRHALGKFADLIIGFIPPGIDRQETPSIAGRASGGPLHRSEEHTSELQSLMRISYAVFCLKNKRQTQKDNMNAMYYTYKKKK